MADKPAIGITGTGSLIGQGILKSIKKSSLANELEIVGFDYFEKTIGSYWCNFNYLLPDILKQKDVLPEWLKKIKQVIREHRLQLLFIGVDFELPHFAEFKYEIEKETGCKVLVSSSDVIRVADDKYLTYQFLKANNFYYPATYLPEDYQKGLLAYPLILKPRIGARSRDVYIINNDSELEDKLRIVPNPVLQELVGDKNTEYTCGVICLGGKVKEVIVLNRTLKEGNTYKSFYSNDTPGIIYDYIQKVADMLQPFGACNFQLRVDNNGIPKIFEINARHSGTTYMRALFGFNEVEYIIQYLLGNPVPRFVLKEGEAVRFYDEFYIEQSRPA